MQTDTNEFFCHSASNTEKCSCLSVNPWLLSLTSCIRKLKGAHLWLQSYEYASFIVGKCSIVLRIWSGGCTWNQMKMILELGEKKYAYLWRAYNLFVMILHLGQILNCISSLCFQVLVCMKGAYTRGGC